MATVTIIVLQLRKAHPREGWWSPSGHPGGTLLVVGQKPQFIWLQSELISTVPCGLWVLCWSLCLNSQVLQCKVTIVEGGQWHSVSCVLPGKFLLVLQDFLRKPVFFLLSFYSTLFNGWGACQMSLFFSACSKRTDSHCVCPSLHSCRERFQGRYHCFGISISAAISIVPGTC